MAACWNSGAGKRPRATGRTWIGNLTDDTSPMAVRPADGASAPGRDADGPLTLNARVECEPDALERMARAALSEAVGDPAAAVEKSHCLKPGRPNPTYRFDRVV